MEEKKATPDSKVGTRSFNEGQLQPDLQSGSGVPGVARYLGPPDAHSAATKVFPKLSDTVLVKSGCD